MLKERERVQLRAHSSNVILWLDLLGLQHLTEVIVRSRNTLQMGVTYAAGVKNLVRLHRVKILDDQGDLSIFRMRNCLIQGIRRIDMTVDRNNDHVRSQPNLVSGLARPDVVDGAVFFHIDPDGLRSVIGVGKPRPIECVRTVCENHPPPGGFQPVSRRLAVDLVNPAFKERVPSYGEMADSEVSTSSRV